MYSLILLSSLLHIITCTVYTVTPDDHYYPNTTCHHCHKLQHYLLNVTKYFTSNTQLLFLPGLHHLHTDLIIQNVHNISLIGSTANGTTLDTVIIQCNSSSACGVQISNIENIHIKNLVFKKFSMTAIYQDNNIQASIEFFNCLNVCLQNVIIIGEPQVGIIATNVLKEFALFSITSKDIKIYYTEKNSIFSLPIQGSHTTLSINHFILIPNYKFTDFFDFYSSDPLSYGGFNLYFNSIPQVGIDGLSTSTTLKNDGKFEQPFVALTIDLLQSTYNVSIKLSNTTFNELYDYEAISINTKNCNSNIVNTISISWCNFTNNNSSQYISLIKFITIICSTKFKGEIRDNNLVIFQNCTFSGNVYEDSMIKVGTSMETIFKVQQLQTKVILQIIGCIFQLNVAQIIKFSGDWLQSATLFIENTSFQKSFEMYKDATISLSNVKLIFKGPVIFSEISVLMSLLETNSVITLYSYIEFSSIKATHLICGSAYFNLNVMENAYIKITSNKISSYIFNFHSDRTHLYKLCYFQFYGISNNNFNFTINKRQIMIATENAIYAFNKNAENVNCKFHPDSLYYGLNPLQVYSKHFVINSKNNTYKNYPFDTGLLCKCQGSHKNCYTNTIGPIYPGQTLKLLISLNSKIAIKNAVPITVKIYDDDSPLTVCKVSSLLEAEQVVYLNCTHFTYNILSEDTHQCKLILYNAGYEFPTVFFIKLLNCPAGFSYNSSEKKCVCDQSLNLELFSNSVCDINDQTILRPANSWISATTHNNSYTYHISLHCPFHYCLPHSSHLNFSTPNSQCQFNRSGVLCGHCQQGLSAAFGSSNCQRCSNVYLLLIIPIAIVGVIFVFLLFYLNLTITNGTINAFILYANIISINFSIFFPQKNVFSPLYTFISLANLDLGIQTCFYNGMDDYAKMWLQLAFPFYLIFIATLIIITSRYSTTIQRLTARRALPVLATLFLLSYTKILRIVSSVLFSYTTITHLPSKHTTLVWSVDSTVPLLGVRFIVLFIVCLILFLILVPFNIILLFARKLSSFRFVNKFKPLLDAYQGPYKLSYYNYTGIQLLIRVIFFALSSLERNINLVLGTIILSLIIGIQGVISPLINKVKNFQEMLYIINLQILYVIAHYDHQEISFIAFCILFSIAGFQFTLILIYHTITNTCSNNFKTKVHLSIATLSTRICRWKLLNTSYYQEQLVNNELQNFNTRNEIPEAVNYHRFQESLLNEDYL